MTAYNTQINPNSLRNRGSKSCPRHYATKEQVGVGTQGLLERRRASISLTAAAARFTMGSGPGHDGVMGGIRKTERTVCGTRGDSGIGVLGSR